MHLSVSCGNRHGNLHGTEVNNIPLNFFKRDWMFLYRPVGKPPCTELGFALVLGKARGGGAVLICTQELLIYPYRYFKLFTAWC